MSDRNLNLQNVLSNSQADDDIKLYVLESFARELDYNTQNELLTQLLLDHSGIAKRLELLNQELLDSREMLIEAQSIAKLGRWDHDLMADNLVWSQSMYEILEIDSSIPASTELFLSCVHPDDREQVAQLYREMLATPQPWTTRYRLLMKSGEIKWVYLRSYYKLNAEGTAIYSYGTIQDITEMKKVEDELEKYSRHLKQLVEEKVQEISASQMATIYALIKLAESRDDETGAHIERTASFCRLLAEKARLIPEYAEEVNDTFLETIFKASPLHDVGKVGIPDNILLKPDKLTDHEFEIMKTHVQIGYDALVNVAQQYDKNEFLKMGMEIALYHHEKWNGSGYMKGLTGDAIPLSARIMALADVYDALRSKRVYKEAFSHEKSMEIIISDKGSHFDPVLVDIFVQHQEEFRSLYESIK